MTFPMPQCSSGTTQSRPDPARAVKERKVRGAIKQNQTSRAAADRFGKEQNSHLA